MTFGQKSLFNLTHRSNVRRWVNIQNNMDEILKSLEELRNMIENQGINSKEVLNMVEASKYLELSLSHLYKLTSTGLIPHYKPNGKKLYFKRSELDAWLLRNRATTKEEIDQAAADYLIRNRFNR